MQNRIFHIHGDNIVECERFLNILIPILERRGFVSEKKIGSFICPNYTFENKDKAQSLNFQFLPGFMNQKTQQGRWNNNILDLIKFRGGPLREAADILVTEIINSKEKPIVAIEYCSALQAGNQAWQRSGRSYSYGKAKIPILYIVDIGGYELSELRKRLSPRLPTPTVAFSYITFSLLNKVQVSQIFIRNNGTSELLTQKYKDIFGDNELCEFIEGVLFDELKKETLNKILKKQLLFTIKSSKDKSKAKFTKDQWQELYDSVLSGRDTMDFIRNHGIKNWGKKYSISTTASFDNHIDLVKDIGLGITQKDLPFCFIHGNDRAKYKEHLQAIYDSKLSEDFYEFLVSSDEPLVLCWIAGFKPKGDDSRPDRGLLPFLRMLIGDDIDILSIVYGPLTSNAFNTLQTQPDNLNMNGLWQAIFDCSNAIIVDSITTENAKNISFLQNSWKVLTKNSTAPQMEDYTHAPYTKPYPLVFSENDVDSCIHNFFKLYEHKKVCYEVLCNPPGGDWSGISILDSKNNCELRWLTLPRVGIAQNKRPDHVIQISHKNSSILLSIESKELAKDIEQDIGNRLNKYVQWLLSEESSASRCLVEDTWTEKGHRFDTDSSILASGIAFLDDSMKNSKASQLIANAESRSNSDISFIVCLTNDVEQLKIKPLTQLGIEIAEILKDNINAISDQSLEVIFL